jgi:hypothetical protein
MEAGNLIQFVHAPPRFTGESPREPSGLLGIRGVIIGIDVERDPHEWGGIHEIMLPDNKIIRYHGDFMKVIQ